MQNELFLKKELLKKLFETQKVHSPMTNLKYIEVDYKQHKQSSQAVNFE